MLSKQKQENQIWKLLLILKSQIKFKQTDPNLPYLIHLARRGMEIVLLGLIQRSNDPEIPLPRDLSLSALFEELFPLCSALLYFCFEIFPFLFQELFPLCSALFLPREDPSLHFFKNFFLSPSHSQTLISHTILTKP